MLLRSAGGSVRRRRRPGRRCVGASWVSSGSTATVDRISRDRAAAVYCFRQEKPHALAVNWKAMRLLGTR
jgi:hypothetical protein